MKYYEINTGADCGADGWCYTNKEPEGIGYQSYKFDEGEELENYPENLDDVTLKLDDDYPDSIKKGSFIGNALSMLIADSKTVKIIKDFVKSGVCYYPFVLLDHKGRVHSKDYSIINPIGAYDYLNIDKSKIDFEDGEIEAIYETVLDASKLADDHHLFRISPATGYYFISEGLKKALEDQNTTNMVLTEINVL